MQFVKSTKGSKSLTGPMDKAGPRLSLLATGIAVAMGVQAQQLILRAVVLVQAKAKGKVPVQMDGFGQPTGAGCTFLRRAQAKTKTKGIKASRRARSLRQQQSGLLSVKQQPIQLHPNRSHL